MRHFTVTIFSGLLFLVIVFFSGVLPASWGGVSRGTTAEERYRETFGVKQGVSQDGLLSIVKTPDVQQIPQRIKTYNHSRTLRAFVAVNPRGVLAVYVESVRPHEYYVLSGNFDVSPTLSGLMWKSETELTFYGATSDGGFMKFIVDVQSLALSSFPIEISQPHPRDTGASIITP